jgi:hypothetical protein
VAQSRETITPDRVFECQTGRIKLHKRPKNRRRIILKCIIDFGDGKTQTVPIWLRKDTSGGYCEH